MSTGRVVKQAASAVTCHSAAVKSYTPDEARLSVLVTYKKFQRKAPVFWWDFQLYDYPLPMFREVLKKQFIKNAHIKDIRIIDRKVAEAEKDLENIEWAWYNPDHVRNFLFRDNLEPKPKDFLSKFLTKAD